MPTAAIRPRLASRTLTFSSCAEARMMDATRACSTPRPPMRPRSHSALARGPCSPLRPIGSRRSTVSVFFSSLRATMSISTRCQSRAFRRMNAVVVALNPGYCAQVGATGAESSPMVAHLCRRRCQNIRRLLKVQWVNQPRRAEAKGDDRTPLQRANQLGRAHIRVLQGAPFLSASVQTATSPCRAVARTNSSERRRAGRMTLLYRGTSSPDPHTRSRKAVPLLDRAVLQFVKLPANAASPRDCTVHDDRKDRRRAAR